MTAGPQVPVPGYANANILEPVTQHFVDALAAAGGPPLYTLTPHDARETLRAAQQGTIGPDADVEDRVIPGGDVGDVSVRVVRPKGVRELLPTVVYLHGGGWILGDKDTHDRLIRDLATQSGAAIVFVNYTPSPEARFPTALEQGYAAARWVTRHGHDARLDSTRLAVAGDSVGGNLTAALALMAKQRGDVSFRMQLMFYPVTDANDQTASYETFADGPWLTRRAMQWFWDSYAPNETDRANILASPLRATTEDLTGLPEALLLVDENDPLRDEGEAYARKLAAAGVRTTMLRYLGTIHDFMMLNALKDTPATREAVRQASAALQRAFDTP
ncbi:alpha/beta hydrolase [Deinococcus pimensis]|uniref:alpha/beta hydrolase n=1 Tax=Deinococcus pimensis TaxID=309888 RepID=UPI0005EB6443|nr:alpha/beta hydrolase [Deinococcus pimensis]